MWTKILIQNTGMIIPSRILSFSIPCVFVICEGMSIPWILSKASGCGVRSQSRSDILAFRGFRTIRTLPTPKDKVKRRPTFCRYYHKLFLAFFLIGWKLLLPHFPKRAFSVGHFLSNRHFHPSTRLDKAGRSCACFDSLIKPLCHFIRSMVACLLQRVLRCHSWVNFVFSTGLVNFVPAVTYNFCLNLPAAFLQPGNGLIEMSCT